MSEFLDAKPQSFAEIVGQRGLAAREQVEECVRGQQALKEQGIEIPLGALMIRKGYLTKPQAQLVSQAQAGRRRIGDYELLEKLGEGGAGAVFKARQVAVGRLVAVKILSPQLARDRKFVERFHREARAIGALNHPNVVAGIDVQEVDQTHLLAMEFLPGGSVVDLLEQVKVIPEKKVLGIGRDIARALVAVERIGMVHRDIKPGNILFDESGTAKLADLGLSRREVEDVSVTRDGAIVGTPTYISPEQALARRDLDIRADIYSLGATMFHMITGQVPYVADNSFAVALKHAHDPVPDPRDRVAGISEAAASLIMRMMAKRPEERFEHAEALVEAFEQAMAGKSVALARMAAHGRSASASRRMFAYRRKGKATPPPKSASASSLARALRASAAAPHQETPRPPETDQAETPAKRSGITGDFARQTLALPAGFLQYRLARMPTWALVAGAAALAFLGVLGGLLLSGPGEAKHRLDRLGAELSQSQKTVAEQRAKLSEAEQQLDGWRGELSAREARLKTLNKTAQEQSGRLEHLAGELAQTARQRDEAQKKAEQWSRRVEALAKARGAATAYLLGRARALVADGRFEEAITLLSTEDGGLSPQKVERLRREIRETFLAHSYRLLNLGRQELVMLRVAGGEVTMGISREQAATTWAEWLETEEAKKFLQTYGPNRLECWFYDQTPAHTVRLTSYYISQTELSVGAYMTYVNAAGTRNPYEDKSQDDDDMPVAGVSWQEAGAFCQWLTESEQKARRIPPYVEYRLPTEAEWERAARGTDQRPYPWGLAAAKTAKDFRGNFDPSATDGGRANDDGYTYKAPVGAFRDHPSPAGCLNMAGNVLEWCLDRYFSGTYQLDGAHGVAHDPTGPAAGTLRVCRGGSYLSPLVLCRTTHRTAREENTRADYLGFRIARAINKVALERLFGTEE